MGQSQQYAITITLNPKMYSIPANEQLEKVAEEIYKIQEKSNISVSVICELTENFNVHMHGYVKVNVSVVNPIKYIYDAFRGSKVVGYIKVKTITDWWGWYDYCVKDRKETEKDLKRDPLVDDKLEIFRHSMIIEGLECIGGACAPVAEEVLVKSKKKDKE